jgi:homoserine dehydrogenase
MAGGGAAHQTGLDAARVWRGRDPHQCQDASPWLDLPQRWAGYPPTLLDLAATRQPLTAHPSVTCWANVLEGVQATGGDVLAEATGATLRSSGEPGLSYIRTALAQGMHVVTSSKGPMALGQSYAGALAQAQAQGYAEADPTEDVEGDDAAAKTLILAAVAFGRALTPAQVVREGITTLTREQIQRAVDQGSRIKHVASLRLLSPDGREVSRATTDSGSVPTHLEARVEPIALPLSDPLARIDGLLNAIDIQTDMPAEVMVVGPGAGRFQAGQGMLADLIAIAKAL